MQSLLIPTKLPMPQSMALLVVRLVAGIAFLFHGWPKIQNLTSWGDGFGIPEWAQAVAAISEFVGGALIAVGLLTPLASLMVGAVMVGALYHHLGRGDPFVAMEPPSWELAAVYLSIMLLLLASGPGRISLDAALFKRDR